MPSLPRVVIVGAGLGGLFAARGLSRVAADVTVVDRHNYHLFQPLLYQVAVAALPPCVRSPILVSIRWLWEYVTYRRGARLITGAEHAD